MVNNIFSELCNSYIYIERKLSSGIIRKGILGVINLEEYSFAEKSVAVIQATEKTVAERIPPRVMILEGAPIELPHVILLCNDEKRTIIEEIAVQKGALNKFYEFELMGNGGTIAAWQVCGKYADLLDSRLADYYNIQNESAERLSTKPVLFCVEDGNHSLVAAKNLL